MAKSKNWCFWIFVIGLSIVAAFIVSPHFFSLTDISWLLEGDLSQTLVGWEFYRVSPPLEIITQIANMYPDSGFYILQSDTMPWVSILTKLIANAIPISKPFHFIGIWLIFCWVFQGIYAGLIGRLLNLKTSSLWLLIFLFVFSPVLLFRFGHFSLMAHWILLAVLYEALRLNLKMKLSIPRSIGLLTLVAFSFGIHPYLFALTAPILMFIIIFNSTTTIRKLLEFFLLALLVYASLKILGVSAVKNPRGSDFGACNTDLLGLFNSFGSSLFVPSLRYFWCQPEGFTYFGLGFLSLLFILRKQIKVLWLKVWKSKPSRYFLLLLLSYIIYSLASPIRFGGNPIIYIPLYQFLEPLPSIFRSSGRWIWPFYYLVLIAGVVAFDRSEYRFKKEGLLLLILIHFIEFKPLLKIFNPPPKEVDSELEKVITTLPHPTPLKKKMSLYPRVVSVGCGLENSQWDYRTYSLVMIALARTGWQIDSGLGGRFDSALVEACKLDNQKGPTMQRPLITKSPPKDNQPFKELLPGVYLMNE